jgi:hypothetical protein
MQTRLQGFSLKQTNRTKNFVKIEEKCDKSTKPNSLVDVQTMMKSDRFEFNPGRYPKLRKQ